MDKTLDHKLYMRRALELARTGVGRVSPNPMVGAVIVGADGRIIGEGNHRLYGQGHAEVNAIASVKSSEFGVKSVNGDSSARDLSEIFADNTMYVTLEPCSHYGKTPPCAKLIIETGIPRVVVGTLDPFKEVSGRGVRMLRDAGVEVITGVCEDECRQLNAVFMTAHTRQRPFVTLKWAQSADGYMDAERAPGTPAYRFSSALGQTLVHRLRGLHDAILAGAGTLRADSPRLDNRLWPGCRTQPRPFILTHGKVPAPFTAVSTNTVKDASTNAAPDFNTQGNSLAALLGDLYRQGITSLLVEGGPNVLQQFIDSNLWDAARVETAPVRLAPHGTAKAPAITVPQMCAGNVAGNTVQWYTNNDLFTPAHPFVDVRQ